MDAHLVYVWNVYAPKIRDTICRDAVLCSIAGNKMSLSINDNKKNRM